MSKKVTASDIKRAIARKYDQPAHATFFEVANGTGMQASRCADAVSMSIWPSQGYKIHGFEIKVSRADFLKELNDPGKSEAIARYCDHWWLTVPAGLVDVDEVPEGWGLMVLQKNGLRIKKKAPQLPEGELDRGFLAAMLRRAADAQQDHIKARIAEGRLQMESDYERRRERELRHLKDQEQRHRDWQERFEAAFGMRPNHFHSPEKFAERIKLAEKLTGEYGEGALQEIRRQCERLTSLIDEAGLGDGAEIEGPVLPALARNATGEPSRKAPQRPKRLD